MQSTRAQTRPPQTSVLDLPDELIVAIARQNPHEDLEALQLVCSRFGGVLRAEVWRSVKIGTKDLPGVMKILAGNLSLIPLVHELEVWASSAMFDADIIERLSPEDVGEVVGSLSSLLTMLQGLRAIRIEGSSVLCISTSMARAFTSLPKLMSLELREVVHRPGVDLSGLALDALGLEDTTVKFVGDLRGIRELKFLHGEEDLLELKKILLFALECRATLEVLSLDFYTPTGTSELFEEFFVDKITGQPSFPLLRSLVLDIDCRETLAVILNSMGSTSLQRTQLTTSCIPEVICDLVRIISVRHLTLRDTSGTKIPPEATFKLAKHFPNATHLDLTDCNPHWEKCTDTKGPTSISLSEFSLKHKEISWLLTSLLPDTKLLSVRFDGFHAFRPVTSPTTHFFIESFAGGPGDIQL